MRTYLRGKIMLLFMTCAVLLAIPAIVFADDLRNDLDSSFDADFEELGLLAGGTSQDVNIVLQTQGSDGEGGCNIGTVADSQKIEVQAVSSGSAASVKWAATGNDKVTFESCNAANSRDLTVTPGSSSGTANVTFKITSTGATESTTTPGVWTVPSTGGGTYDVRTAQFKVNVTTPNTPPTVSVTGVEHGATYDKGAVPDAGCLVTDTEDGLNASTTAATLTTDSTGLDSDGLGLETVKCSYEDGGNVTVTASATYTIQDPSAPVIGHTLDPAAPDGSNGWYKGDVSLTWNVSEPQSPNSLQKTGCDDQTINADQQETTYSCSATSAGGSTGPVDVKIKRDGTAPEISGADINNTTWRNTDLSEPFTASDATSGLDNVADASFTLTTSGESPNSTTPVTASKTVDDKAGNSSTRSISALVDKTKPSVSVTGVNDGATYTLGSVPAAGCSTSDGLSGKKTDATLQPLSGGPVGSVTATCSGAEDNAGNTGSASVTYNVQYAWTGFFRPVDNLPTLNTVKAGSSVPVKFSLAGNQGLNIFASGSPASKVAACDAGASTDAIEETVTAGNSSLSYDATADQYNYVWKTEKAWAGTCRQLQVKLADGTTHAANFKLLK